MKKWGINQMKNKCGDLNFQEQGKMWGKHILKKI